MRVMPVAMGALMGPMMLWLLHDQIMGLPGSGGAWAAIVFLGGHALLLAVVLLATVFAARLSLGLHARLARLHKPSALHLALMLGTAATSAGFVHLAVHGGLSPWI